jgi:hypothetical protein
MRLGEMCQLDRDDLVQRDGVWCLRIEPSEEDEEGLGQVGEDRGFDQDGTVASTRDRVGLPRLRRDR